MIFEHEWRADAPPYAGRHRKGWVTARGRWVRVCLPRARPEPDPALPDVAQRTHRGRPAVSGDRGTLVR